MPPPALGMVVSIEAWVTRGLRACLSGGTQKGLAHYIREDHIRKDHELSPKLDSTPRRVGGRSPSCGGASRTAGMGRGRRVEAILSEFPEPSASQLIVRVSGTPGSNLLRVEDASGCEVTVRLPSKTKNTIWVRTGGFLIINVTTDVEEYGDVAHFLYKDQIRYLQTRGLWPAGFASGDRSDTHREAVRKLALQP